MQLLNEIFKKQDLKQINTEKLSKLPKTIDKNSIIPLLNWIILDLSSQEYFINLLKEEQREQKKIIDLKLLKRTLEKAIQLFLKLHNSLIQKITPELSFKVQLKISDKTQIPEEVTELKKTELLKSLHKYLIFVLKAQLFKPQELKKMVELYLDSISNITLKILVIIDLLVKHTHLYIYI